MHVLGWFGSGTETRVGPACMEAGRTTLAMETSSRLQRGPAWYRIVMLSATAFAIEFCYAVVAGYGTPALLKTGLDEKYVSVMWAIGPVLGILFQGYLGSASDRCKCSWGRRRPFILGLAIALCIALGLFPYGEILSGQVFHLSGGVHTSFVIAFTAVTFVAMDFCLDMLQSPVRSYLLDSVPPERSERGNSIYSAMIGIGATIGAVISAIPWKKLGLASEDIFEIQVKVVFGISVGILIVAQLLTLCSVKESRHLTYKELSVSSEDLINSHSAVKSTSDPGSSTSDNQNSKDFENLSSAENCDEMRTANELESSHDQSSVVLASIDKSNEENLVLELSTESVTVKSKCNRCHCLNPISCFKEIVGGMYGTILFVKYMSFTFFRLWISAFFSWFSFLANYLFFTTFVGEVVYGGSPSSEDEQLTANYDEGVIVGCAGLVALYFVSFVYSLLSEWTTGFFGIRCVVTGAHLSYLVSCGVVVLYPSVLTAMVLSGAVGVYFSILINFPFALIPYYKVNIASVKLLMKKLSSKVLTITRSLMQFLDYTLYSRTSNLFNCVF